VETERVDVERMALPSGAWWDIRARVTRGMRKRLNAASLRMFMQVPGYAEIMTLQDPEERKEKLAEALKANPGAVDWLTEEDAMLLEGTVAWSFPEPVSAAAIDDRDDADAAPVLERMRDLYARTSVEVGKA